MNTPTSGTVFVVDDDDEMRESLKWLIETIGLKVEVFSSGPEFRASWQADLPGCLLLDLKMPGQGGLELYQELIAEGFRLPVIFMSAHADTMSVVTAMKTGAIEFIEKPFDRKTLLDLIISALTIDQEWRRKEERLDAIEESISKLTRREQDTLSMIMAGEPNKRIAIECGISERAVEMRRARIMQKLDVTSLAEMMDVAITHRLRHEIQFAVRRFSGDGSA